ncbi:amidase signature domain-containing protein [Mycena rosella]|uniref:Amidase signature domain-containing protein n=1 Tax=Mycena rosella TaxID=1033263 RepID=A0AAD7GJR1_MYCRO|nr:amidase signature domain-containing protein [Mycena rosella]
MSPGIAPFPLYSHPAPDVAFLQQLKGPLSEAKQTPRAEAVSAVPKFSPSEHGAFIKATASNIVDHIKRGEWTTTQVKATLFTEALEQVKILDDETNMILRVWGFSAFVNKPAATDADIVAILESAGAVPIAKTNIPQTMFSFECSNPIFGRTTNPYNEGYTSGGSSGGEAALIAMDGVALGVGSDTGGSMRIPAAFCSFKPSPLRSLCLDLRPQPALAAQWVGVSAQDLDLFCRVVFGVQARSPDLAPISYREHKLPEKLRFGYYAVDCAARQVYRKFYDQVWNTHALDGIIAPVQALPQVAHGHFTTIFALAVGTTLYNVVNSPTGCIPVTKVDPTKDGLSEEWTQAPSPSLVESALYRGKKPMHNPVAMEGMPVGIQIAG